MRKILRIVRREYIAAVHTKGFIIGLIIAPIIMGGGFIALAVFKDRVDTDEKVIALIDHSGVVSEAVVEAAETHNENYLYDESGKQVRPAYRIEVMEPDPGGAGIQKLDLSDRQVADLAASFQEAVVDCLVGKAFLALRRTGRETLCVGGGVAANTRLRERLEDEALQRGVRLHVAPLGLCTDNAVMGAIAVERVRAGLFEQLDLDVYPGVIRRCRAAS